MHRTAVHLRVAAFLAAGVLVAAGLSAQAIRLPDASPHAVVTQRIGMTDITVDYHRPGVKGRKVWGGIVPLGQVWRAGANDNTTISFSTDVQVEGQPLVAGTYGLHMLPTESKWTIIFSKNSTSWGSFSYDQKEDALRVDVTPGEAAFTESLAYEFSDLTDDGGVVSLKWEKLRVPFAIRVDTHAVTLENLRNQLRHTPGFTWQGFFQAAQYCLQENINLDEALGWVDRSIQAEERFANLQLKSQILEKKADAAGAKAAMEKALGKAQVFDLHTYARQLLGQGKTEEALKIFRQNAEKNPDSFVVHVGLARGLAAVGDFAAAEAEMRKAIELAPEAQKATYRGFAERLAKGENIN